MATFLTVTEASRVLGVSPRALRNRHNTRGVGQRIGTQIVFTPSDLELLARWPWKVGNPQWTAKASPV